MRKLILLIFVFIALVFVPVFADEFIIGTGTISLNWLPFYGAYDYSWGKMLYTKTEINTAGLNSAADILALSFYVDAENSPDNYLVSDQMIYMRHTNAVSEDDTYPGTTGFTLVYNRSLNFYGGGWKFISLDTPFNWDNVNNLEILWENRDGTGDWGYPSFIVTSTSPTYEAGYTYQDTTFPANSGYLTYSRPNLRLTTEATTTPNIAISPYPADNSVWTPLSLSLMWQNGGGMATGCQVYFGTDNPPPFVADVENLSVWNPPGFLNPNQIYYWQIVPYNSFGDATGCPVWSFTTAPANNVQIGTGIYEQWQPFGISSGYERSTALYTSQQLDNHNGIIDQIAWCSTTNFDDIVPYKIYMRRTNDTEITFLTWNDFITGAVLVKQGTYQFSSIGWHTFVLDTGFHFVDGNIIVGVETNYGGSGTSPYSYFYHSRGNAKTHQFWEQDDTPPLDSGELNQNLPNIRLHIAPPPIGAPQPPILIYPQDDAIELPKTGFNLIWSPNLTGGIPDHYDLLIANLESANTHQSLFENLTGTSFNPVTQGGFSFNYNEHYDWTIRAVNAFGDAITTPWHSFVIESDPTINVPSLQSFVENSIPPGWTQTFSGDLVSNRWLINQTNNAGGVANEMQADWCDGIGISRLISPPIDTRGLSAFNATFKHYFQDYAIGLTGRLQYSHDLVNWYNTGWSFDSGSGDQSGTQTALVYFGIAAPVTYLSWTLDGDHWQFYNWWLDDVSLSVAAAHDVGMLSIDFPEAAPPQQFTPRVTVINRGNNPETFNVTLKLGLGYTETQHVVNLDPGITLQVEFAPFTPIVNNSYGVLVYTNLTLDENPLNDSLQTGLVCVHLDTVAYANAVYDQTGSLIGPCTFNLQSPGNITILPESPTGITFITAADWMNGSWYGVEFYSGSSATDRLWQIDCVTGAMTLIGHTGATLYGLAYDSNSDLLYGASSTHLYSIDLTSGLATLIGPFGCSDMNGIAHDHANDILYGINTGTDALYSINQQTGFATLIGFLGIDLSFLQDCAFDQENGYLFLSGYTSSGALYWINTLNGSAWKVGNFQNGCELTGFAIPYSDLIPPEVTISSTGTLFWESVSGAARYKIYGNSEPIGTFTLLDSTSNLAWTDPDFPQPKQFYMVRSVSVSPRFRNIITDGIIPAAKPVLSDKHIDNFRRKASRRK